MQLSHFVYAVCMVVAKASRCTKQEVKQCDLASTDSVMLTSSQAPVSKLLNPNRLKTYKTLT